jgi:hypothetical protein
MADSQNIASNDLAPIAPVASEALTEAQADDALTALLGGNPETDPAEETEGNTTTEAESDEPEQPSDEDELDPSQLPEDDEAAATEEDPDAPQDYAGGRFASDDAKVTLDDGSVISVAELKRNNLFQRDYSKKTEEVARQRDELTTKEQEFSQLQAQVQQEREFALWYLEQNAPQEPKRPELSAQQDPMAWLEYQEKMGQYNTVVQAWQVMHQGRQAEMERAQKEQKAGFDAYIAKERDALFNAVPVLKDENRRKAWFEETWTDAGNYYGFTAEELNGISDHRVLRALKDATRYQKARAKAPTVQKEVQARPPVAQGSGRRPNPEAQQRRETDGLRKQLRETGSAAAADAYLAQILK